MTVEKIMEATQVASNDPLTNIDLEIMNTLKQMFEEAKKQGFKGTFESYQKSLSVDDLKRIDIATSGQNTYLDTISQAGMNRFCNWFIQQINL